MSKNKNSFRSVLLKSKILQQRLEAKGVQVSGGGRRKQHRLDGLKLLHDDLVRWHVLAHSIIDYQQKQISSRRRRIHFYIMVFQLFVCLRYLVSISFGSPTVWLALGDPIYVYGHHAFMSMGASLITVAGVSVRAMIYWNDIRDQMYFMNAFVPMISGYETPDQVKLTQRDMGKLGRRAYYGYHLSARLAFIGLAAFLISYHGVALLLALYFENQENSENFTALKVTWYLCWYLILAIDSILTSAACMKCVVLFYIVTSYIKYRYRYILSRLKSHPSLALVRYYVHQHNEISDFVKKFNQVGKFGLFLVYAIGLPQISFCIFLVMFEDVDWMLQMTAINILVNLGFCIFVVNHECAKIAQAAHQPYSYLNSVFVSLSLPILDKLKLQGLIEKLAGPKIALYCLDLFPFTNVEFFDFSFAGASLYIVFLKLFEDERIKTVSNQY